MCTVFPFIYIAVAIITKLTMPGPVFFRQKRNGLNGEEFYCIKFRSMKVNDDSDKVQCTKDDPRKTKWGDIMRKTNIDELPQFINVLKGDMSIVGPRPHMLKHTEEYSKLIDKYMLRHIVKPGITGWSQVTGFRGADGRTRVRRHLVYRALELLARPVYHLPYRGQCDKGRQGSILMPHRIRTISIQSKAYRYTCWR